MYKILRNIQVNKFLAHNSVRTCSQNASVKSKKIGLVGMGNVGKVNPIKTIKTALPNKMFMSPLFSCF